MVIKKLFFVSYSNHFILHSSCSSINMAQHSFEEYDKTLSVPRSIDQTHNFDKYLILKKSDGDFNVSGDLHRAKGLCRLIDKNFRDNRVVKERCKG